MHALLEFLPIVGLLVGYLLGKSVAASEAMYFLSYGAIVGVLLQFLAYYLLKQKMQKMALVTAWLLLIFALITVVLRNDLFIKLKPTVAAWAFAVFFMGYAFLKKMPLLKTVMGQNVALADRDWWRLDSAWILFNAVMGFINLFIVLQIQRGAWSDDSWVTFKVALLPITLVFIVLQGIYIYKKGHFIDPSQ